MIHPDTIKKIESEYWELAGDFDPEFWDFISTLLTDNRILEEELENQKNYRKDGTLKRDTFLIALGLYKEEK